MKCLATMVLMGLAGCQTSSVLREHEVEASLPRALGLGAFATNCVFLCFPTTTFTHGDDTIDPNATQALMRSKLVYEQEKGSNSNAPPVMAKPLPSIIKRPKHHPAIKEQAP